MRVAFGSRIVVSERPCHSGQFFSSKCPSMKRLFKPPKSLGAKLIACDTTLKICGFSAADATGALDEVIGLASILRLTQGARVISL